MPNKNKQKLMCAQWQRSFPCEFEHHGNTEHHGKFLAGCRRSFDGKQMFTIFPS